MGRPPLPAAGFGAVGIFSDIQTFRMFQMADQAKYDAAVDIERGLRVVLHRLKRRRSPSASLRSLSSCLLWRGLDIRERMWDVFNWAPTIEEIESGEAGRFVRDCILRPGPFRHSMRGLNESEWEKGFEYGYYDINNN